MFPSSPNIKLILLSVKTGTDDIGNPIYIIESSKEVIGINRSVTSKEHFDSKMAEHKIELSVKIISFLYGGEKHIQVKGEIYEVERTYLAGQFIELYLTESKLKASDIYGNH